MKSFDFIRRYGLWTNDQARQAEELKRRAETGELQLVRIALADPHGASRAKSVTVPAFLDVLENGYNINIATATLDGSGERVFKSFTRGGGMDLDEMTGSPNLTVVPDPSTFRVLPWAPHIGWVLCDQYFHDGTPFHFSTRHLLKQQIERLKQRGLTHVVGLESEWYLSKIVQENLAPENIGEAGVQGKPIATAPVERGFSYHSETGLDIMQPVLDELTSTYLALDLPLRSMENEFGPGQVECTFTADDALHAADNYVLYRTATRQVCRRLGYFASFMCRPGIAGHVPSGWHLHQSITDEHGENLFTPADQSQHLSPLGQQFLAGLLDHAPAGTVFGAPTVNAYRRFLPNSLAPTRASWGYDHRGTMMRVLGGAEDPATRIENRAGEPAANPYLFIASQIVAGLDGLDRKLDLWPADDDPYNSNHAVLPLSLKEALGALDQSKLYRHAFGDLFVDYYLAFKGVELGRFGKYCEDHAIDGGGINVTEWEQNEYYDFF
ncbi:MAG: glutamine synthetase [Rhodospirillales bacterium]|nr:glutamine synthetase [Rhodospirillales bacterium]